MAALAVAGFGQDIGDEMFVVGCWDVGVLCCQDFDGMFFFSFRFPSHKACPNLDAGLGRSRHYPR